MAHLFGTLPMLFPDTNSPFETEVLSFSPPKSPPEGHEGAVRGGMIKSASMSVLAGGLMSVSEDIEAAVHQSRTGKLGGGAAVETVNMDGDSFTTLDVTCGDKVGLIHKISSVLTSSGLLIQEASVKTDKVSKIATETFKLIVADNGEPLEQCYHEALQDIVISAIEGHTGATV